MKRPTRKRSYLLLEIMISLVLISLCLFPLIHPHLAMRKSHAHYVKKIEYFPLFQKAFCEIKQMLYEQKFSWKELTNGIERETKDGVTYAIKKMDSCKKPSLESRGLLIGVTLSIDKMEQSHTLFIQEVTR